MAEYKRIVSYIYAYRKGERQESAGYVKLEKRDGRYRITLRLCRTDYRGEPPCRVYLLVQDEQGLQGILLGEWSRERQDKAWKNALETGGVKDTPYGVEDTVGILLRSEQETLAAQWEDQPLETALFQIYQLPMENQLDRLSAGNQLYQPPAEKKAEEKEEAAEGGLLKAAEYAELQNEKWEALARQFPIQHLSANADETLQCLRVEPQELQRLPREGLILEPDSFLLRGCCRYRHLLLCRSRKKEQTEYYLGIPGICSRRESLQAENFGFQTFRRDRARRGEGNSFGYWFRRIEEF